MIVGVNIWMLDHDPIQAARWHCDAHVKASLFTYAQVLAFAWHSLHNEVYAPLDDLVVATPWIKRVDAGPYTSSKDRPRAVFPGESPWSKWLLFGQHVPARRCDAPHASELWVEQAGGNYSWLWKCALELSLEYERRFGKRHPATPSIWTLEVLPPALEVTLDTWSESPVDDIPAHLRVVVDGFYDVVATNRRYYNTHQNLHAWTASDRRAHRPPPWITKEEPATDE